MNDNRTFTSDRVATVTATLIAATAVLLVCLATVARPLLHPTVMRLNFSIGAWTAFAWRVPPWIVCALCAGSVATVLSQRFLSRPRWLWIGGAILLALMVVVVLYASALLRPFTLLERQMQMTDRARAVAASNR